MMENKPPFIVVPLLVELLGEDEPQTVSALLPTISLSSRLLVLLPEVSNPSVLAGLILSIIAPTSAAPLPWLSLAPMPILLSFELASTV